jgi:hypothetical protein
MNFIVAEPSPCTTHARTSYLKGLVPLFYEFGIEVSFLLLSLSWFCYNEVTLCSFATSSRDGLRNLREKLWTYSISSPALLWNSSPMELLDSCLVTWRMMHHAVQDLILVSLFSVISTHNDKTWFSSQAHTNR